MKNKKNNLVKDSLIINEPFPHLAIDNFVSSSLLRAASMSFPSVDWPHWHRYGAPNSVKVGTRDRMRITTPSQMVLDYIATHFDPSAYFDNNTDVFPDLDYYAGGMHMLPSNGFLGMHIDTDIHGGNLNWKREYSVVLCASEHYDSSFDLLLHNGKNHTRVPYKFNRLMAFKCSDDSWHGVPDPITEGMSRKTLAVFFWSRDKNRTCEGKRTRSLFRHDLVFN